MLNVSGAEKRAVSKTVIFVLCLVASLLLLCGLFVIAVDWPDHVSSAQKWVNHNRFLADAFLVSGIAILFYSKHGWLRLLSYVFALFGIIALLSQYLAFVYSRDFVPLVAVENIALFDMVDYGNSLLLVIVFLIVICVGVIGLERSNRPHITLTKRLCLFGLMVVLAAATMNDRKWLSLETVGNRYIHFRSSLVFYPHKSPIGEFVSVFRKVYQQNKNIKALSGSENQLSPKEREFVDKHNISWGALDPEYPLAQHTKLPLPSGVVRKANTALGKPNLIVFFVEGLSARLVEPYSQKIDGITPNIEAFAKESIVVEEHFNHTFATYRGLSGGHCSIFSHGAAIAGNQYRCFPHILNDNGYQTEFYYSQQRSHNLLDEILDTVGVSKVFAFDELVSQTNNGTEAGNAESYPYPALSDKDLMRAFILNLKKKEQQAQPPFYMGFYNIETHTRKRPYEYLKRYSHKQESPANYIIDSVHNFDAVFGEFWDYFKNSPLAKNTIVVFTTDHARFPEKDYMSMWGPEDNYLPLFTDRIPLIINSPFHKLEPGDSINTSSSLDLAPSLLHLLGIYDFKHHFLGQSIFHKSNRMLPMAMGGHYMMYQHAGNMHILDDREPNQNYHLMQRIVERTRALEKTDRLWRRDINKAD